MAADKGSVRIHGRFPTGTTVKLFPAGAADVYTGAGQGSPATSAKTDKDGFTEFSAPPGRYFAVAEFEDWNAVTEQREPMLRSIDVTIHSDAVLDELTAEQRAQREVASPEPPAPSFSPTLGGRIIEGARGTHHLDPDTPTQIVDPRTGMVETFAGPVGHQIKKGDRPVDGPVPAPRQEDHRGVPLASSTLTGEAVPPQPQPPAQEDSKKSMAQASDTETGVQVPARELVRQEDFKGKQASDTQTGTAFPVDPNAPRRSGSGTGRTVSTGSAKPAAATQEPKGRSGSAAGGAKAEAVAQKGNEAPQAKAAEKAADDDLQAQPAEDARGVQQREVPEQIGSPEDAPTKRASSSKKSGAKKSAKKGAKKSR